MTEQVSAFLDGELDRRRLDKNIQSLLSDKQAMQKYRDYQAISDVMRGEHLTTRPDFSSRIMAKIDAEPTVLSPNAIQAPSTIASENTKHVTKSTSAAWSIAASVAAVMVVGLISWQNAPSEQPSFAQAAVGESAMSEKSINRIATVDSIPDYYLEAHRVSAPSVGSHYIHTVNYSE